MIGWLEDRPAAGMEVVPLIGYSPTRDHLIIGCTAGWAWKRQNSEGGCPFVGSGQAYDDAFIALGLCMTKNDCRRASYGKSSTAE